MTDLAVMPDLHIDLREPVEPAPAPRALRTFDVVTQDGNTLKMILGALPDEAAAPVDPPATLFGLTLPTTGRSLAVEGGRRVLDDAGVVAAVIDGDDRLWVPHAIDTAAPLGLAILQRIADRRPASTQTERPGIEAVRAQILASGMRQRYMFGTANVLTHWTAPDVTFHLGYDAEDARRKRAFREDVQRQLAQIDAQIAEERRRLADASRTQLPEVQRILNLSGVRAVEVRNGVVMVWTEELVCDNPTAGTRHLLGRFLIEFHRNGLVRFNNQTRLVNGRHHPHVPAPERACLGNINGEIQRLVSTGEFALAVQMALGYLRTCNPEDAWGQEIQYWPLADLPFTPAITPRRR